MKFTAANVSKFVNMLQGVLHEGEVPIYVMGNHDSTVRLGTGQRWPESRPCCR
jgi:hypothetical protein